MMSQLFPPLTLLSCLLLLGTVLQTLVPPAAATSVRDIPGFSTTADATATALAASNNDDVITRYLPLEKWLQQRDLHACLSDTRADILFAVDGSESVSLADFHLVVKSVLVDTISRLEIGENFIQVGVLVFSAQVTQVIPIGKYADKLQLLRAVSRLSYDGSYTAIDAAIEGCIAELGRRLADGAGNATSASETIEERKRVVVFVTDGRHSSDSSLGGGGGGVYMRDLLGQLHRRVTAVMALGLQNSAQPTLLQLATDPGLVFDPTAYPDYQTALYSLLNMRCSGACYKYEQQEASARKVIATLVQYVNYLIGNYASYRKQEAALVDYARGINASVVLIEGDIERTCNAEDNGLLRRIVTLQDRIRTETNGTNFAGASIDAYVGEMIRKISAVQRELFEQSQRLATEKSRLAGTALEEERLRVDFQARLDSKLAVRRAQEQSQTALETRIETYRKEMVSIAESVSHFENITVELSSRLSRQEAIYTSRQAQLSSLTQQYTMMMAVQTGGELHLAGTSHKLALCQAHQRDGYTTLFAIRCGSGAAFEALFSREDASFSDGAFEGLSELRPVYKSPYLRQLHTMGFFASVTWQFLDANGGQMGTITMDTSRFELSSLFSRARVATSFPWVASYVNSIYSASLDHFRPSADAEFLLVFGDLTRYRATGSCSDIVGVFLVLAAPHRCYPEAAAAFPRVYISASPFGGPINVSVAELRLVTSRLPADRPLPTRTTNQEQLSEVLLYAKTGAGYLHSLLLTSRYTPAALLADVDDLSQLARHYKSSLLGSLNLDNYRSIKLELFNQAGRVLAALTFKGPFATEAGRNGSNTSGGGGISGEIGVNADSWAWFQAKYLAAAEPFDVQRLRSARFVFYNGVEFFAIGEHLADDCARRSYYLTLVDGSSACQCFGHRVATPGIYFADDSRPQPCDRLATAESFRLTGELVRPQRHTAGAAAAAAAASAAVASAA